MVVHHIENNTDPRLVEFLNEGFQFHYPAIGIFWILGIPALRGKIVMWIIAPVIVIITGPACCLIGCFGFVGVIEIQYRHKLDMGYAERLQIGYFFDKCQIGTWPGLYSGIG